MAELDAAGLRERVVLTTASEFGRTYSYNGRGTDHAWGGNQVLLGGAVRGGRLWGRYPHDAVQPDDRNIGRGRFIPSMPWEGLWSAIAGWMGVTGPALERAPPDVGGARGSVHYEVHT